ncbi:MAG: hypothetical protein QXT10_04550 [Candidatus Bathyarchaeia archaeon]
MASQVVLTGIVIITLKDEITGETQTWVYKNTIVAQGRSYIRRNICQDTTQYNGTYIGLSTSTTAPADSETTLPPTILGIKAYTSRGVVTDSGVEYAQWETTFGTDEGNGTIGSIGLCENSDGSGEWGRVVLGSPITKNNTQTLNVKYRIAVNSA